MAQSLAINPEEVVLSKSWGTSQGRRVPSNSKTPVWNSYTLEVAHLPTDVRVLGQIAQGTYSRTQIIRLRQQLYQLLVKELERKVRSLRR